MYMEYPPWPWWQHPNFWQWGYTPSTTTTTTRPFPEGSKDMRRFALVRGDDVTGVSGTGVIATGVEWGNGFVAIQWRPLHEGHNGSLTFWPSVDDMMEVHGHDGATTVSWID